MSRQYTDFVFTINNPETGYIRGLVSDDRVSYLVYQLEKDTSEHVQGYVEFEGKLEWKDVKETMGKAWYNFRKGSRESARNYCMKESTRVAGPWERGVWVDEREGDSETCCEGITTKGLRCKNMVRGDGGFCKLHDGVTPPVTYSNRPTATWITSKKIKLYFPGQSPEDAKTWILQEEE